MQDPDNFTRIVVLQTLPNGIMIYGGPLKTDPSGSGKPQAYRFPKDKFSVSEAKTWLKEHDIKYILFEPAEAKENMSDLKDLFSNDFAGLKDIEIFNTFTNSHGIPFTVDDLDDIVENFNYHSSIKPNVKISHTNQQTILKELFKEYSIQYGEELPALGFIEKMYRNGKSIFANIGEIPEKLKFVYQRYKTISPEIVMNYKNTGKKLLNAIVLTNNPALKHIPNVYLADNPSLNFIKDEDTGDALRYGGNLIIEGVDKMADQKPFTEEDVVKTFGEKLMDFFKKAMPEKKEEDAPPKKVEQGVVSLSEVEKLRSEYDAKFNDLNLKLIEKEKEQKNFSERIKKIQDEGRKEKAEAMCSTAINNGVPKVIIDWAKPILMSDKSEETIKLSEMIDDKIVEANKSINSFVQNLFEIYPDKVDFSDRTRTQLVEPGNDDNEEYKKIEKRANELIALKFSEHEAWEKAGLEIRK